MGSNQQPQRCRQDSNNAIRQSHTTTTTQKTSPATAIRQSTTTKPRGTSNFARNSTRPFRQRRAPLPEQRESYHNHVQTPEYHNSCRTEAYHKSSNHASILIQLRPTGVEPGTALNPNAPTFDANFSVPSLEPSPLLDIDPSHEAREVPSGWVVNQPVIGSSERLQSSMGIFSAGLSAQALEFPPPSVPRGFEYSHRSLASIPVSGFNGDIPCHGPLTQQVPDHHPFTVTSQQHSTIDQAFNAGFYDVGASHHPTIFPYHLPVDHNPPRMFRRDSTASNPYPDDKQPTQPHPRALEHTLPAPVAPRPQKHYILTLPPSDTNTNTNTTHAHPPRPSRGEAEQRVLAPIYDPPSNRVWSSTRTTHASGLLGVPVPLRPPPAWLARTLPVPVPLELDWLREIWERVPASPVGGRVRLMADLRAGSEALGSGFGFESGLTREEMVVGSGWRGRKLRRAKGGKVEEVGKGEGGKVKEVGKRRKLTRRTVESGEAEEVAGMDGGL